MQFFWTKHFKIKNNIKIARYSTKKSTEVEMSNVKEKMTEVILSQPEDATYEEIMRELAFERMVARGLEDSRHGRVVSNDEMQRRIRTWQK
jgi:predicted transcriptional regulator